jgi:hypothetical protein
MLTAVFFQIQAESREQEMSAVKSLHHTPPYPIHHLPYTMLTAVFFQIQAESREQQVPAVKSLHHTPPYPIHHLPYTTTPPDAAAEHLQHGEPP